MSYLDNVDLYFDINKEDSKRNGSYTYADWDADLLDFYNKLGGIISSNGVIDEISFQVPRSRRYKCMRLFFSRLECGKLHVEFSGCRANGTVTMRKDEIEELIRKALAVSCLMCENGYLTLKIGQSSQRERSYGGESIKNDREKLIDQI